MPPKRKVPKDKEHALACKKSGGAKSRLTNFKSYCKDTGYMGIMCLKPTWTRGKPRAFKSRNWTGPVLVPKENGKIGEGDQEMIEFVNLQSDTDEEGGAHGDFNHHYYGSPRTRRPLGDLIKKKNKRGGKNKSLPPRRCHACGEVFMEEERTKWISCGGPGEKQKGCLWMAHIRCWCLQVPKNQLSDFCDRIVRCTVCQDIEEDMDVENSGNEGEGEIEEGELDDSDRDEQGEETDSDEEGKEKKKPSSKSPRPGPSRTNKFQFGSSNKKSSRVNRGLQRSNSQRNGGYSSSEEFAG